MQIVRRFDEILFGEVDDPGFDTFVSRLADAMLLAVFMIGCIGGYELWRLGQ